ncbi:hypothetical protein TRFO_10544 [Tritrichomonas foetus]|uniref:Uncharacterized protein n=1 Tax=Tritrichomonas foetus TaxID=1144522 RepID=A0A1J4JCL9_9EUKA|nr:hypothetical protein TRFO_10544 [Tritrichomonas foetus]|eukprot:OHS95403.1 hypothetical protein TRFO_10544 [Tritrichomonas foetus]
MSKKLKGNSFFSRNEVSNHLKVTTMNNFNILWPTLNDPFCVTMREQLFRCGDGSNKQRFECFDAKAMEKLQTHIFEYEQYMSMNENYAEAKKANNIFQIISPNKKTLKEMISKEILHNLEDINQIQQSKIKECQDSIFDVSLINQESQNYDKVIGYLLKKNEEHFHAIKGEYDVAADMKVSLLQLKREETVEMRKIIQNHHCNLCSNIPKPIVIKNISEPILTKKVPLINYPIKRPEISTSSFLQIPQRRRTLSNGTNQLKIIRVIKRYSSPIYAHPPSHTPPCTRLFSYQDLNKINDKKHEASDGECPSDSIEIIAANKNEYLDKKENINEMNSINELGSDFAKNETSSYIEDPKSENDYLSEEENEIDGSFLFLDESLEKNLYKPFDYEKAEEMYQNEVF